MSDDLEARVERLEEELDINTEELKGKTPKIIAIDSAGEEKSFTPPVEIEGKECGNPFSVTGPEGHWFTSELEVRYD